MFLIQISNRIETWKGDSLCYFLQNMRVIVNKKLYQAFRRQANGLTLNIPVF